VELVNVSSVLHSATVYQEIETPESLIPLNSHCSKEKEKSYLITGDDGWNIGTYM